MRRICFFVPVLTLMFCAAAVAAEGEDKENAELRRRISDLEQSLNELRSTIALQARDRQPDSTAMRSSVGVELYGYIKLDASYDTSRTDEGNYARWVVSDDVSKNDNQFNLTPRQSRFGLNFFGPQTEGMKSSARVEIDFYGGGAENKNIPMMRHAYLKVEWPRIGTSILAGQTSDTISPLFPATLNYIVGWWAGNPGYRRAQLRVSKEFSLSQEIHALLEVAAARTIGHDNSFDSLVDTGEDAGFPSIQGRWSVSFPLLTKRPTAVGLSGHWGKEVYAFAKQGRDVQSVRLDTWSVNVDLTLPLTEWLSFQGEFFTGADLDAYLAGIGQGILIVTDKGAYVNAIKKDENGIPIGTFESARGIAAIGGWGAFGVGPFGPWRFNLGGSVDDPHNGDIPKGGRTQNLSIWGNMTYDINKAVQAGLELSYWNTKYKDRAEGEDFRVQTALIYKF
jgi:hypothetical protein